MKLSINILIPTILLVSALIGAFLLFEDEIDSRRSEIYKDNLERVKRDINRLQNILYTNVTEGDEKNARLNLSITAMDKSVRFLSLVDASHKILLSNRYRYENTSAIGIREYDENIARRVVQEKKHETYFHEGEYLLRGYFPVKLPVDRKFDNSFDKIGIVYIEYSLKNKLLTAEQSAIDKATVYVAVMFFIVLIVSFLLYRLITVRLLALTYATSRLAHGDFGSRVKVKGNDELSQLGIHFNAMAEKISHLILQGDNSEKKLVSANVSLESRTVELKSALEDQAEKERIMRLSVQGSGTGIFIFDFSTGELFWDEKSLEIFAIDKSDFTNDFNAWTKSVYKDDLESASAAFQKNVNDKAAHTFTLKYRTVHPDKSIHYIRGEIQIERNSSGEAVKVYGLHFDDTKVIYDEEQLKQAKESAEIANRIKSDFLANMSHEIRTPLNGIMSVIHLFKRTELNSEQSRYLKIADDSSNMLLSIINDILDFSKIESGQMFLESTSLNPSELLQNVYDVMSIEAEVKSIGFILTKADDLPYQLLGDPKRLRQIVMNLVNNAIKFTQEGQVELYIYKENNKLVIGVKDTGIGLSDEQQNNVVIAFTQGDTSHTRKFGGTGLGLTVSQHLISSMGSHLHIESTVGQGSNFYFKLPIRGEVNYQASHEMSNTSSDNVEQSSINIDKVLDFTGCPLLLVEDNDINQLVAVEILEEYGFDIDICDDGEKAIQAVKDKKYKIVLMDIQMPVLDGIEATKRIRALGSEYESLPIIAMTAHAITGDREKSLAAGMNGHITKPFDVNELITNISKFVEPSA